MSERAIDENVAMAVGPAVQNNPVHVLCPLIEDGKPRPFLGSSQPIKRKSSPTGL